MPAKLKCFVERVFEAGVVAEWDRKSPPKPLLKGKTTVIIQTCDAPYTLYKYFHCDFPYRQLAEGILRTVGIKVVKRFEFSMVFKSSDKRRAKWLARVEKYAQKTLN